ncbi:hypothetical protein FRC17_009189 [Serendipita sp. 399]|nr:hypothetical protein FRC17_009189 [Serendipita sp. 399]
MPQKKKNGQKKAPEQRERQRSDGSQAGNTDQGQGTVASPASIASPSRAEPSNVESTHGHLGHSSKGYMRALTAIDHLFSTTTDDAELLPPLKATYDAIKMALQSMTEINMAEELGPLIKSIGCHLVTIENHVSKLEEDHKFGLPPLPFDSDVKELLWFYLIRLQVSYRNFLEKQEMNAISRMKLANTLLEIPQDLDDAFQSYTSGLILPATAERPNFSLAGTINVYGIQHRSCLQGTREKTLKAIYSWVENQSFGNRLFCLIDVAGSGKSTISKHMAVEWNRERRMVARFFFSRDSVTTMSTNTFCTTVGDAFAHQDPTFKVVMDEFKTRPDYSYLSFEEQFEGLVATPLRSLSRQAILIIDGMDECNNTHGGRTQLLITLAEHLPSIPCLWVFMTSRPEKDIKAWASKTVGVHCTNFMQLEGDNKDVEKYIKYMLNDYLPSLQEAVYAVVCHAEGLFIWARIACDLLVKTTNIKDLLGSLGKEVTLDHLYMIALEQSVPLDKYSRQATVLVLSMILAAREPLSIADLEKLSPRPDVIEPVVTSLGSVLLYEHREDPIRLLHATLREFLTGASRAGPWHVQLGLGNHILTSGCIEFINQITNDGVDIRTMDEVSKRMLKYSSLSWIHHCGNSCRKLGLNKRVTELLEKGYHHSLDAMFVATRAGAADTVVSLCHHNMVNLWFKVPLEVYLLFSHHQ